MSFLGNVLSALLFPEPRRRDAEKEERIRERELDLKEKELSLWRHPFTVSVLTVLLGAILGGVVVHRVEMKSAEESAEIAARKQLLRDMLVYKAKFGSYVRDWQQFTCQMDKRKIANSAQRETELQKDMNGLYESEDIIHGGIVLSYPEDSVLAGKIETEFLQLIKINHDAQNLVLPNIGCLPPIRKSVDDYFQKATQQFLHLLNVMAPSVHIPTLGPAKSCGEPSVSTK